MKDQTAEILSLSTPTTGAYNLAPIVNLLEDEAPETIAQTLDQAVSDVTELYIKDNRINGEDTLETLHTLRTLKKAFSLVSTKSHQVAGNRKEVSKKAFDSAVFLANLEEQVLRSKDTAKDLDEILTDLSEFYLDQNYTGASGKIQLLRTLRNGFLASAGVDLFDR